MDFLEMKPPIASNMIRGWECQMRSNMLRTHKESINDKSLKTLLIEVKGILNSKPLTRESIGDVNSYLTTFSCYI